MSLLSSMVSLCRGKSEYNDFDVDAIICCNGIERLYWQGHGVTREYLLPELVLSYPTIDLFVEIADQLLEE